AGAQLGAWASRQSATIDGRQVLEARLAEMEQRFAEVEIPLPPHWGGYRVKPEMMEFWQGRPDRLHDRFRYTLQSNGTWSIDRLPPGKNRGGQITSSPAEIPRPMMTP